MFHSVRNSRACTINARNGGRRIGARRLLAFGGLIAVNRWLDWVWSG